LYGGEKEDSKEPPLLGPTNAEIKDRTLQMHPDQKWREKKK
jgi:hypothetical protein